MFMSAAHWGAVDSRSFSLFRTPSMYPVGQGGRPICDAGKRQYLPWSNRSTRSLEKSCAHDALCYAVVVLQESLLKNESPFIPPEYGRLDHEALERPEGFPKPQRLGCDNGIPTILRKPLVKARANHEIHPGQVHDGKVLSIVHVPQDVQIRKVTPERREAWPQHGNGFARSGKKKREQKSENEIHAKYVLRVEPAPSQDTTPRGQNRFGFDWKFHLPTDPRRLFGPRPVVGRVGA